MKLPPDIERYVERCFAAVDRPRALRLIGEAVVHDGKPAGPRLVRCALLKSAGDLGELRRSLEHLRIDYRDVILAAEYERRGGEWVQVRDLNGPLRDDE